MSDKPTKAFLWNNPNELNEGTRKRATREIEKEREEEKKNINPETTNKNSRNWSINAWLTMDGWVKKSCVPDSYSIVGQGDQK